MTPANGKKSWMGRWVACTLLICGVYPAQPAHADRLQCGPPTDWVQLANISRRALQFPDEAGGDEMRQISETMRDMNWTRLRDWQQKIQKTRVDQHISQSIETLRNYSQTGVMQAPWILLHNLNRIEDLTQTICVELSGTSPLDLTRLGGEPSVAGFGLSPNGGTPQDYIRLGILPVAVAAFAVCLKLGVMLLQLAQTMRYKRRSCDVLAELRIGPYVFKGSVTILGVFGCRFVCADEDGRTLLTVVAETGPSQLHVGDIKILAKVTATQSSFAAIRFDDQLPDETYAAILKRSSTKPRLVRLPRLRHNVAPQDDSQIDVQEDHIEEEVEELTFERPDVRLELG